jgi:hypothetical protein
MSFAMTVRTFVLKLHIYAGLLSFAQLVIYGVAGLAATVEARPRPKPIVSSREVAYTPPPSKSDKEVADNVYQLLALPLTRPMPLFAIKRNEQNDLLLDFYNINGIHRVTVLEREHKLRIDEVHNGVATFLTPRRPDWYTSGATTTCSRCGACSASAYRVSTSGSAHRRDPGGPGAALPPARS